MPQAAGDAADLSRPRSICRSSARPATTSKGFSEKSCYREEDRCTVCYQERLLASARLAKNGAFDCFTTTLLYSRFQKHDIIRQIGESIGRAVGVPFPYRDFRTGWRDGVEESKRLGLYRQQYCGCIYSEKERYYKTAP